VIRDSENRLLPIGDLAFKKLLASEDHKTVTQGFIADFFGFEVDVDQIRIETPYSIQPHDLGADQEGLTRLRQTLRDVTLAINTNVDLIIEVQQQVSRWFEQRAIHYLCGRYQSHYGATGGRVGGPFGGLVGGLVGGPIAKGLDSQFSPLRPVHGLNITVEPFAPRDHPAFAMFEFANLAWGLTTTRRLLHWGYFDLSLTFGLTDRQAAWRQFLLTGQAPPGAPAYLEEAASMMEYVNLRGEERAMVDVLEKALATENDIRVHQRWEGLEEGLERGLVEGLERGEARKAQQIAARMLAMGMDPVVVAEATGLSLDQLRDLDAGA
jgi:hypothetical protein